MKKKTITICGSMQFRSKITELKTQLENLGWQVFTPNLSEKSNQYLTLTSEEQLIQKRQFISDHFEKIKKSDSVLIANYNNHNIEGYIGANTLLEIGVAHAFGKSIYIMNEIGNQSCCEEVLALQSVVVSGKLEEIKLNTGF